jgi:hypothetical protein
MADALALSPQPLQQSCILESVPPLKLHANALRQCRAVPSGRDGDLQGTATDDGGRDEVAGVGCIDNVHPDVVLPRSPAHGHIHRWLIGGADDQRTA